MRHRSNCRRRTTNAAVTVIVTVTFTHWHCVDPPMEFPDETTETETESRGKTQNRHITKIHKENW